MSQRTTKKKPKTFEQSGKIRAVVEQVLSWAGAPCLGYWGVYHVEGPAHHPIHIPDLELDTDMGDGAEVEITWSFRVVKPGKRPTKKCMNPWPAHRHDSVKRERRNGKRRKVAAK